MTDLYTWEKFNVKSSTSTVGTGRYTWYMYNNIRTTTYSISNWSYQSQMQSSLVGWYRHFSYDAPTGKTYFVSPIGEGDNFPTGVAAYRAGSGSTVNKLDIVGNVTITANKTYVVNHYTAYVYPQSKDSKGSLIGSTTNSYNAYTNGALNADGRWYERGSEQTTASTSYSKGSYVGTVTAAYSAYSNNARNPDGYWYVRGSLVLVPQISGQDENLGNKNQPFYVTYGIPGKSGKSLVISERLNGNNIDGSTGLTDIYPGEGNGLLNRKIMLSQEVWDSLELNKTNKIEVTARFSDSSANSKRTWTFVKTNSAPKIEIVEPTGDLENIAIVDTTTPVLVHRFLDIDGDIQTAYQYVVEDVSAETEVHNTGKVSSTQSFLTVPDGILNWGSRYKFKVKVWDKFDVPSEYSDYEFFMPNRPPTATNLAPGSNSKETPEGTGSEPTFTWAFTDLDLEAQGSYQLKIYKTQDDMLVYNSNRIYKNIQTHTIPQGVLENGYDYYAVLKVWDVNNLSAVTPEAYFRTNATPTTPTQTLPIDNCRTTLRPTFQAIIGRDNEDDGMHFAIQVSKDENFSNEVLEYNSKMQRNGWKVNGSDIDTIGATNSSEGQIVSYEMQVDLDRNSTYFWRICGVDANTGAKGAWSSARRVRIGNVLEFELKSPIDTQSVAARRILIAMEYALPQDGNTKAEMKLEVCNNAFDSIPTWENATEKFLKMDYYEFVNYSKTAENYGISIRVTINSNDSMKEIAVYSLGVTFD